MEYIYIGILIGIGIAAAPVMLAFGAAAIAIVGIFLMVFVRYIAPALIAIWLTGWSIALLFIPSVRATFVPPMMIIPMVAIVFVVVVAADINDWRKHLARVRAEG